MNSTSSLARAALAASLAFSVTFAMGLGCSKDADGTPDAGTGTEEPPDAAEETPPGKDAGPADGGFYCHVDDDCGAGLRCEDSTGKCVDAEPCQDPSNCGFDPTTYGDYCDTTTGGLGCRCVQTATAPSPYTGYCKRRLPPCHECTNDADCGDDPNVFQTALHNPGKCVDFGGQKVCLETYSASKCISGCGVQTLVAGTAFCGPLSGKCSGGSFLCCKADADCPREHPNCDESSGQCKDVCTYNFERAETVGCPPSQVCNVLPKFLTSTTPSYGAGECAAPCTNDSDCTALRSDFVCKFEQGSAKRCRPAGCISDFECPEPASPSPFKGYCERSSGACQSTKCRVGSDLVTGRPYDDCKPGYKCDGATLTCVEKNCVEQGGADLACAWDEFCCGEDRNGNGTTSDDACTPAAGQPTPATGKCYKAPSPPWCKACQQDTECSPSPTTNSTNDKAKCINLGQASACVYPCDLLTQCPRGTTCNDIFVDCSQDPSVCGAATRCVPTGRKDANGNDIKQCTCTTAGAVGGECPNARCKSGGGTLYCTHIKGCIPGGSSCQ